MVTGELVTVGGLLLEPVEVRHAFIFWTIIVKATADLHYMLNARVVVRVTFEEIANGEGVRYEYPPPLRHNISAESL